MVQPRLEHSSSSGKERLMEGARRDGEKERVVPSLREGSGSRLMSVRLVRCSYKAQRDRGVLARTGAEL
jgi:hypothetical protein